MVYKQKSKKNRKNTIFFPARSKSLAKKISIKSPSAFKSSIKKLEKGGLTTREKRGLVLAQNRAKAQLKRKNLSKKEREQFKEISKIKIPKKK